jgi:flagellar motor protein MotB
VGFLILPPVIELLLEKKLSEQLNREVKIRQIHLNPYALSLRIEDFLIRNRNNEDTLLSLKELYVNIQIASAFKRGLILKEVRVERPYVNMIRNEDGTYSISDLLEEDKEVEKEETSQPMRFSVNNIQILSGSIDFRDGPKHTQHKARDITIKIPMISNFSYFVDTFVQPFFQATINDTPVLIQGKTKPFHDSFETVIDLDIKKFNIPHYLEYIPFKMNSRLASGTVNAANTVSFTQYRDRPSHLTVSGDVSIHDLMAVDKDDNPLITLPVYILSNAYIDFGEKEMTVGEVYSENGTIDAKRYKDGAFNLRRLLPRLAEKLEETAEEKEVRPWIVLIKNLTYEDFTIKFEDHVPSAPVNLIADDIKLRAENISTQKDSRGSLTYSLKLNETGNISAKSSFGINPVAADVTLSLKDINIIPFQPYITDKVNILITDGAVSADGNLSYATSEEVGVTAEYKGNVSISKFASVDKLNTNDFLKWNSLYVSGIHFEYNPLRVTINEAALADFYSLLIINADGTLNVQGIMKKEEVEAETTLADEGVEDREVEQKSDQETPIKIETVTMQAGTINFSDKHVNPNYSANMLEIGGRISGLSSVEDSRASVDLRGKLEKHAPLVISGSINPLQENLFVDLTVDFKDMDLSPLTPYANKYMGYTIQKGKLSLDLKYLVENKELDSSNNVFLDQFTLGERVENPDATKLPVKLAIALLKNRKGEITLDLPVKGNIDNPEFSIGSTIAKLVLNIFIKAATSPFALLGALVGGGEELSYVDFDYGSFILKEQGMAKLDKLVKALHERPHLNIDIAGYTDTEQDLEGLRDYTFNKKLKAQKLKEMVDNGETTVPVDEVTIEPGEFEKYLKRAYEEEKFPKPRNVLGLAKELSSAEMEKLIYAYIEINDDDLRQLASRRALKVKDYFLANGQIDPKRIFLIEPESPIPDEKDKLKKSRVEFTLK